MNESTDKPLRELHLAKFPWRGVIGSLLMYGSFASQNMIATDLSRKHQELDQAQLAIDLQLLRFEAWTRAYHEQLIRDEPDKSRLGYCAAKALQARTQIRFYSELRIEPNEKNREQIRVGRAGLLETHRQWLKQEKWDTIITDFTAWIRLDDIEKFSDNTASAFIQRKHDIVKAETRWTTVFFVLFTIGTLLERVF